MKTPYIGVTDFENVEQVREIKAIYVKRFNQISVMQTDQDVRVVE